MRNHLLSIKDILDSMELIDEFLRGVSLEEFRTDKKTISAVRDQMMVIGEAVKNVPDNIKVHNPEIPWKEIAGMRDVLIHSYFRTDPEMLYIASTVRLHQIKPILKQIYLKNVNYEGS
jgi:uncharacterized protein with HEPN domain